MASLIDLPGPYSPTTDLEKFLAEMRQRPPDRSTKFAIATVEGYLKAAQKKAPTAKQGAKRKC